MENLPEILTMIFESVDCIFEKLQSLPSTSKKGSSMSEQDQIRDGLVKIQLIYDILERDYQKLVNKYDHLYVSFGQFKKYHFAKKARWNELKLQLQERKKPPPASKPREQEIGIDTPKRKSLTKIVNSYVPDTSPHTANDGTHTTPATFPYIYSSEAEEDNNKSNLPTNSEELFTKKTPLDNIDESAFHESTVYPYTLPIPDESTSQIEVSIAIDDGKANSNTVHKTKSSLDRNRIQGLANADIKIHPQTLHPTQHRLTSDADSDATDLDVCDDTQLVTADENEQIGSETNHTSTSINDTEKHTSFNQDMGSPLFLNTFADDDIHPTQIVENVESSDIIPQYTNDFDISHFFSSSNSQSRKRKLLSLNNRPVKSSLENNQTQDAYNGSSDFLITRNENDSEKYQQAKKKSPEKTYSNRYFYMFFEYCAFSNTLLSHSSYNTPTHRYIEVVRNKEQRKKMHGNDCSCCKKVTS
ncbi:hypothetical protein K7432_009215 [Basidiobolus ranarum]